jgi:phenylacetate-coenzyme A ligase PaaK-like adenylate-forming protein
MLERFEDLVTDRRLKLAELERHVEEVRDDEMYLDEYRVMCTGGTSGRRGIYVFSRRDWSEVVGGYLRFNNEYVGLTPRLPRRRKLAVVAARSPLHMTARIGSTLDIGLHRILRLDARSPLHENAARLQAFEPDGLTGYPSTVALLAGEQLAGRLRIAPKSIITTSEVRTAEMEDRIVAAWGCSPFNLYASTETGVLAADCDQHQGLHVYTDQTLLEVVDGDGQPVPAGTPGQRILVTSLVNRTQPLIRFELTDLVTISSEPCPCGRPFPLLVAVDGRSDDILHMPAREGGLRPVHPLVLRSPLARISGLQQYRVIHDSSGLTVEAVLSEPHGDVAASIVQALRSALHEHGIDPPAIRVDSVREIARHGQSGKMKLIEARGATR